MRYFNVDIVVVDSVSLLQSAINAAVTGLRNDFPSLFIDLEGMNLGRHGSISIMSLYVLTKRTVYLIDVCKLGNEAFSTSNGDGKSLKYLLECPATLKVFFDARRDLEALSALYGVSVDGIRDVQLMELGTRKGAKDFLAGLGKCVVKHSTVSAVEKQAWELIKSNTRRLFDPAFGGRYDIFNERPVREDIKKYCAGDVTVLPDLFKVYDAILNQPEMKFWKLHVLGATKERIRLARNLEFASTSKFTARGPWDQEILDEAINQWNDDVLDNALNCEDDDFFEAEYDDVLDNALNCEEYDYGWEDDGPTSCRDIINDCDYEYYYSD
ncbi:ribonuclease H-like domain-containing protein [Aspergillus heterothallicus]